LTCGGVDEKGEKRSENFLCYGFFFRKSIFSLNVDDVTFGHNCFLLSCQEGNVILSGWNCETGKLFKRELREFFVGVNH
jgi:hypothetical protein